MTIKLRVWFGDRVCVPWASHNWVLRVKCIWHYHMAEWDLPSPGISALKMCNQDKAQTFVNDQLYSSGWSGFIWEKLALSEHLKGCPLPAWDEGEAVAFSFSGTSFSFWDSASLLELEMCSQLWDTSHMYTPELNAFIRHQLMARQCCLIPSIHI